MVSGVQSEPVKGAVALCSGLQCCESLLYHVSHHYVRALTSTVVLIRSVFNDESGVKGVTSSLQLQHTSVGGLPN